jgi:PqqD family protein of HPr-rel-A system
MKSAAVWRPLFPGTLAWREWDDELVVYNDATGNTHHLSPIASAVLLALAPHRDGIDTPALVRLVEDRSEPSEHARLPVEVGRTLDELERLQLVARDLV